MTTFVVGTPVETTTSTMVVDAGLPVGNHRFSLTVFDTAGNASAPSEVVVQVTRPVVVLTHLNATVPASTSAGTAPA
jgi:hypothetical protein